MGCESALGLGNGNENAQIECECSNWLMWMLEFDLSICLYGLILNI